MNGLVKNKQICETMREMSKEMMKSGLIEEMVNDVFEEANGMEDMEAETEAEVNKVLAEIAGRGETGGEGEGLCATTSYSCTGTLHTFAALSPSFLSF